MRIHKETVTVHEWANHVRNVNTFVKYTGPAEVLDGLNVEYLANLAWSAPGRKITVEIETREIKRG